MIDSRLYFGTALAWDPRGQERNWRKTLLMHRRPEEAGADVQDLGGREPQEWQIEAVLFGNSMAELWYRLDTWEGHRGLIHTYARTGTCTFLGANVVLLDLTVIDRVGVETGTEDYAYRQRILLRFARVAGEV